MVPVGGSRRAARIVRLAALLAWCIPASTGAGDARPPANQGGVAPVADRSPDADFRIDLEPAIAWPGDPARMQNVGSETRPEWRFSNRLHGPVAVLVEFAIAENVVARPALPSVLVLPAGGARTVLLEPRNPVRSWRYRIRMTAVPGDPGARHESSARYVVPLPPGVPIRIDQGFFGTFSHQKPHSRYAIDLVVDEGTPVRAARSGTVMDVQRNVRSDAVERMPEVTRANYVRILHGDGSMAVYAHLEHDGVLVRPGQSVRAGQVIGLSGNTGYSTGPHLHFAVQVNRDMQLESIPFEMVDHAGHRVTPVDDGAGRP